MSNAEPCAERLQENETMVIASKKAKRNSFFVLKHLKLKEPPDFNHAICFFEGFPLRLVFYSQMNILRHRHHWRWFSLGFRAGFHAGIDCGVIHCETRCSCSILSLLKLMLSIMHTR
jgi:hypothetical protein